MDYSFALAIARPSRYSSCRMEPYTNTLAYRLGKTTHVSPLRYKLAALRIRFPCASAGCIEDWLIRVANARGARVVVPPGGFEQHFEPPPHSLLSDSELVVAICQLNGLDRPQMLRLAAQLISRGAVDLRQLRLLAERERAQPVLAELSRQALRVQSTHPAWREVHEMFKAERPLRSPLLHWTRLAEPVMKDGRFNAVAWRLVA
jgi:hypothetical protein